MCQTFGGGTMLHKIFLYLLIGWVVIGVWAILSALIKGLNEGGGIGTILGAGFVFFMWFLVTAALGIVAAVTRPKNKQ